MVETQDKQKSYEDLKEHASKAARMLKTLSSESRLMILCALEVREYSVTELHQQIGLSQSALSQHLATLRREGMVKTRRESQVIYYSLAQSNTTRIIEVLSDLYCPANG
ncbi:MAG TPA: metalloregulator ArsR/SmtB family transcription factor [Gammaproteobacteria bacterium]|jgi:DNA-binding transcriptional ArsR family regulator|nr:winged helix-turn-helix transcriptional regulator [Xanthomonadales bacterium]HOP21432.1 metalloregulator ArsR/SmtB family transcription factor [Gammaproteobacteria bacterium]MCB1594597.1 winged helix-turn-helix transcriptional regulator [Xanthomonadales bacterium]MCB1604644.1 winged helix-turn-helix transcriptional regulator [Xanthomonadales bacterium]HPI94658.1 metalloregulator ArsR/SmtB family transcription factor [Gammaproteobacteria bacterium]